MVAEPERIFNNRYRIEHRIGNGGMAIVYSGTDTLLRRRVAIKVLREQYAADDDFVKRFSYEAQAAAKLSHPNIVNVYDFGTEDDNYFIVMELVDGETLATQISADRKIPEPVAVDYAIQVASGLAFAHRQGLLHRDIKPANLLITKDDVVKISDFGIARAVSETSMGVTQPGMVMGSVYYVSPEQAQGFDIDETSDLYSLGIVLYQMLTGTLPFTGDTPVAVALKHVSEPAPSIDPALGVSPALASIVERLLLKDPQARYRSATELATALREARERPTVAQAVGAGAGVRAEDATIRIPAARAPQPPPRRSAAPDHRAGVGGNGATTPPADDDVDAVVPRPGPRGWLFAVFALLLFAAVGGGYFLFRPVPPAKTIALDDYSGRSSAQAQQALLVAGLQPHVTEEPSTTVPPDRVIRQDPAAGTKLAPSDDVSLVVSSGPPLRDVPDIVGFSRADAQKVLAQAGFRVRIVQRYGNETKDSVVAVNPQGKARAGNLIVITVSQGLQPVTVPNVVSMNVDAARALLQKAGLQLDIAQREEHDDIPENTIASQDPRDGSQLDHGGIVSVNVSTGAGSATIPNVESLAPDAARAALRAAGFDTVLSYNVDPSNGGGTVTAQQPAAQTSAKRGTKVAIFVSVPGTVPDVAGMSLDDAKKAIATNGYVVGNIAVTDANADGKVDHTEPAANTELRPGETVQIYYHPPSDSSAASPAPSAAPQ